MPPDFVLPDAAPFAGGAGLSAARRHGEPGSPGSAAPHAAWLTRIAVRSLSRIVIVPVHEIVRLDKAGSATGKLGGPNVLQQPHFLTMTKKGELLVAEVGGKRVQVFSRE